jgi:hypothetical protein
VSEEEAPALAVRHDSPVDQGGAVTEQEQAAPVSVTPKPSRFGYWARFRRRFRWVALGVFVVILAAVLPWPWGHGTTLVGLHLPADWVIVALDYLWYLLVVGLPVGLLVAAFPARRPNDRQRVEPRSADSVR